MQGINTLIEILKNDDYQYRNYRYIDDIAFGPMLRATPEFNMLVSTLEKILYDPKSRLQGYFFLKQKHISFNFQLQYELNTLSDYQCQDYVRCSKEGGSYRIDGYCFDYDHALKYVRETIVLEEVTVFIHVGIASDTGFQIRFEH